MSFLLINGTNSKNSDTLIGMIGKYKDFHFDIPRNPPHLVTLSSWNPSLADLGMFPSSRSRVCCYTLHLSHNVSAACKFHGADPRQTLLDKCCT